MYELEQPGGKKIKKKKKDTQGQAYITDSSPPCTPALFLMYETIYLID